MANRFQKPTKIDLMDTIVPIPYEQMQRSLELKQKKYDVKEAQIEQAKTILDKNVFPELYKINLNDGSYTSEPNPQFEIYKTERAKNLAKIDEIQQKLSATGDTTQADKDIKNLSAELTPYLNRASIWEDNSKRIKENFEAYQKDDHKDQNTHNYLNHNAEVDHILSNPQEMSDKSYNLGKRTSFVDINSRIKEFASAVNLDKVTTDSITEAVRSNGLTGLKKYKQTTGNNNPQVLKVLEAMENDPMLQSDFMQLEAKTLYNLGIRGRNAEEIVKKSQEIQAQDKNGKHMFHKNGEPYSVADYAYDQRIQNKNQIGLPYAKKVYSEDLDITTDAHPYQTGWKKQQDLLNQTIVNSGLSQNIQTDLQKGLESFDEAKKYLESNKTGPAFDSFIDGFKNMFSSSMKQSTLGPVSREFVSATKGLYEGTKQSWNTLFGDKKINDWELNEMNPENKALIKNAIQFGYPDAKIDKNGNYNVTTDQAYDALVKYKESFDKEEMTTAVKMKSSGPSSFDLGESLTKSGDDKISSSKLNNIDIYDASGNKLSLSDKTQLRSLGSDESSTLTFKGIPREDNPVALKMGADGSRFLMYTGPDGKDYFIDGGTLADKNSNNTASAVHKVMRTYEGVSNGVPLEYTDPNTQQVQSVYDETTKQPMVVDLVKNQGSIEVYENSNGKRILVTTVDVKDLEKNKINSYDISQYITGKVIEAKSNEYLKPKDNSKDDPKRVAAREQAKLNKNTK